MLERVSAGLGLVELASRASNAWTAREIDLIVDAYLKMLDLELRGEQFVKSRWNQALRQRIIRSRGAVEYKHQNISAVMEVLGLPFIRGYRPMRNYQEALFEAIEKRLAKRNLLQRLAGKAPTPSPLPQGLTYQSVPELRGEPAGVSQGIRRVIRKFDPAQRDARMRELGEAGERFLFKAERDRLKTKGRADLAAKVRWVAKEDGDGAGFDILSFSLEGEERWLEVKTTNGAATTPFWITENERRVSEEHQKVFRLTRIYEFSRGPKAFQLKPPLSAVLNFNASVYKATFR